MTISIFPQTHGDLIVDLRYILHDGELRTALVAVDKAGKERELGRIIEFRDGGGHVEIYRFHTDSPIGITQNSAGVVMITPEVA